MKSIFFAIALLLPAAATAGNAPLTSKRPMPRQNNNIDIIAEVILHDVQKKFAANHGCEKTSGVCIPHTKK